MAQAIAGPSAVPPVLTYVFAAAFFLVLLGAVLYLTYIGLTSEGHSAESDPNVDM